MNVIPFTSVLDACTVTGTVTTTTTGTLSIASQIATWDVTVANPSGTVHEFTTANSYVTLNPGSLFATAGALFIVSPLTAGVCSLFAIVMTTDPNTFIAWEKTAGAPMASSFSITASGPIFRATANDTLISGPEGTVASIQSLSIGGSPAGGFFTLTFDGEYTAPIAWSNSDATLCANIANALDALYEIGSGGVTCTLTSGGSGVGVYAITFVYPATLFPRKSPGIQVLEDGPFCSTQGQRSTVQYLVTGGAPSGGYFTLSFDGEATDEIAWSSTDSILYANIASALNAR